MSEYDFGDFLGGNVKEEGVSRAEVTAMLAAATDPAKLDASISKHKERVLAEDDLHALLAERMGESRNQSAVVRHSDPANKVSMPTRMTEREAIDILEAEEHSMNQTEEFYFPINVRWEDGALALVKVLEEIYGASGVGQRHFSFFGGETPPAKMDIVTGVTEDAFGRVQTQTETVPGSEFYFAPLKAKVDWAQRDDGDDKGLFMLRVELKTKNRTSAKYIATMIERYVAKHSIFKGQILRYEPIDAKGHYNLVHVARKIDNSIVYSKEAARQLQDEVLGKITGSADLRAAGRRDTFKVLVYGPLGTGKTAFLIRTAVVAKAAGRTVIEYNPKNGVDINELIRVNRVARRFDDAVVLIEDIDQFYPVNTHDLSKMTNLFDGVDKTSRVSYLMTTNHVDNVEPEMTRPPRLTGIIEVGQLDRDSIEEMFHLTLGDQISDDVDFDAIWAIVDEFSPSFIRNGFDKAFDKLVQDGRKDQKLNTDDLVFACSSLVSQHRLHLRQVEAKQGRKTDHLTVGLAEAFAKVMAQMAESRDEATTSLDN